MSGASPEEVATSLLPDLDPRFKGVSFFDAFRGKWLIIDRVVGPHENREQHPPVPDRMSLQACLSVTSTTSPVAGHTGSPYRL